MIESGFAGFGGASLFGSGFVGCCIAGYFYIFRFGGDREYNLVLAFSALQHNSDRLRNRSLNHRCDHRYDKDLDSPCSPLIALSRSLAESSYRVGSKLKLSAM